MGHRFNAIDNQHEEKGEVMTFHGDTCIITQNQTHVLCLIS